jgi:hypothetical protein
MEAPDRLAQAATDGLLVPLDVFGFRWAGSTEGDRGSSVELTNGRVLIRVVADWLEGELSITLRVAGEGELPVEELVDLSRIKGLHLARLPKSASADQLASQLKKVADALVVQAPAILSDS